MKTCLSFLHLTFLCFLGIVSGCGSKDQTANVPATHAAADAPAADSAPVEAPPPPPAPGTATAAATAAPSLAAPVPVDPTAGDPLAHFRFDPNGKRLDDHAALQAACDGYSRLISSSVTEPGQEPWPNLNATMSGLIEKKLVAAIPPAPGGKRYVFDTETHKVKVQ
ncbi:MAG: hypothetical protein AB1705_28380, partial [Verrucomicrobiota bacterium]